MAADADAMEMRGLLRLRLPGGGPGANGGPEPEDVF
ncbi:hypothetical protein AA0119_g10472 [Alternaria tenuissima]|jgi:hypothetical protein|uniref:Uncharacterized protein n=2 Tax=Alternaria alternata complex TaxID=187734 RepID=A0A4Q4NPF0_ALTAL|nr:hypothetical protein AA0115_g3327 [Alternaria tenuissima]RYN80033.1 hypothetical protein AA0117_g3300 [Alternaria alternata]RYN46303.1 hypothetical protein AA0114_g8398 [Alternaria tenuissima]RYN65844.1 hypothetical protein AA0118_g2959 [Alternaria tenuissima]RYN91407.1 hypothetical protein AA0119_g10472 [Alternaria tenuissima]